MDNGGKQSGVPPGTYLAPKYPVLNQPSPSIRIAGKQPRARITVGKDLACLASSNHDTCQENPGAGRTRPAMGARKAGLACCPSSFPGQLERAVSASMDFVYNAPSLGGPF